MQTDPITHEEPTPDDLAEIEREMPLIEAGVALINAEIALQNAGDAPSPMDFDRLRLAEARVRRLVAELANTSRSAAGEDTEIEEAA